MIGPVYSAAFNSARRSARIEGATGFAGASSSLMRSLPSIVPSSSGQSSVISLKRLVWFPNARNTTCNHTATPAIAAVIKPATSTALMIQAPAVSRAA